MSKTTNAQEKLGGKFRFFFGKRRTLNDAVLNLWKFVNRLVTNHKATLKGLSIKYSQYPPTTPKSRKHRRVQKVGRGRDITLALEATNKAKSKKHLTKSQQIIKSLFPSSSSSPSCSSSSSDSDSENDGRPKKTKTSLLDPEWETAIARCPDGSEKFRGMKWSFRHGNTQYTNTCPLDSFLSLLFILHKGELMVHPLAEVQDETCLLARAFKELSENDAIVGGRNARMLFVDEFYKAGWLGQGEYCDIFSDLDIFFQRTNTQERAKLSPILDSIVWKYTRPTSCCTLGDNCQRPAGPRHTVERKKITQLTRLVNTETGVEGPQLGLDGMKRIIDEKFKEREIQNDCAVAYFNTEELTEEGQPKQESRVVCPGRPVQQEVRFVKYPHLAVIDLGEGALIATNKEMETAHLADVPFDFVYLGKRWVLRGVLLGDNHHFTAVARLPNFWMHYDGLKRPALQLHSLDRKGSTEAMHGRAIGQIFYELLDQNEEQNFGSEDVDYSTVFHYRAEKRW